MKALILFSHALAADRHERVRRGEHPQADYDALAEAIRATPGGQADILDMTEVARERGWLVRLSRRWLGDYWAMAMLAFLRCRQYDVVMSHSEIVGLPLSLLLALLWRRPRHVSVAFYLHGRRNWVWYRLLRSHNRIDKIILQSRTQYEIGRTRLRIPESGLLNLESCGYVDIRFFEDRPVLPVNERQVCSAGREFRDFATLVKAAAGLPDIAVKIDPASPWSLHRNYLADEPTPANVEICRLELGTIWRLYGESAVVAVPLLPNPISAGSTTLVEAMAMGKPVIVTRSADGGFAGWADLIDGENVILVNPGDVDDMRRAIALLMGDPELRQRIGANGRRWAQKHAGREEWLRIMLGALSGPTDARRFNSDGLGEWLTGIHVDHHSLGRKK